MTAAAKNVAKARRAAFELARTMQRWRRIDAIRSQLPARLAARIPRSRLRQVLRLVERLRQAGAIDLRGGETSDLGVPAAAAGALPVIAVIAVAAGVSLVALGSAGSIYAISQAIPAIQRESRLSKQAAAAAAAAKRQLQIEQQQASRVGPERARDLARERAAETRQGMTAAQRAESALVGAGASTWPAWAGPAALVAGAGVLAWWLSRRGRARR